MYDFQKAQRLIGYTFNNPDLLREALMHRSFATEHNIKYDNQRLEFLGDAVLQIILTEYLFKRYPELAEGDLTKIRSALANQSALAQLALRLDLGNALMLGHGEQETGGRTRESTLSDTMEAVLGAIMLDSDLETARQFYLKLLAETVPEPARMLQDLNPKGLLQEFTQSRFGCQPEYRLLSVSGPDHSPVFRVEVCVQGEVVTTASANKRKTAEGLAAHDALNILHEREKEKESAAR